MSISPSFILVVSLLERTATINSLVDASTIKLQSSLFSDSSVDFVMFITSLEGEKFIALCLLSSNKLLLFNKNGILSD